MVTMMIGGGSMHMRSGCAVTTAKPFALEKDELQCRQAVVE
jgi:hypothetical protein